MINLKDILTESVMNFDDAHELVKKLKKQIDAPEVSASIATLGGKERPSVILSVSLNPKNEWPNGIYMNSMYSKFYITYDGIIEQFAKNYKIKKKFRKSRFKNTDDVIKKINKYIKEIEKTINESKVHYQKKLKNGTTFQVIGRDTKGMRGTQDKFQMQIVDKSGKVVKDLGSHPSVKGAEKFGNKFESVNESDDTTSLKKIHDSVFKFLKTKKGVGEVKELSEFPNRYGDNVSTFSVRYNIEDKYNYDSQGIKIEYSRNIVSIPNKGYFPFKTFNDIKNIINTKSKLKESVNERYRPNLESKGWEAAQKVIRQLQSSVFKKLDDDELLEFRKAIADAFNLDGVLKENNIIEGTVTKTFHFKGKTSTDIDEIDADFSRQGIKSEPDFNNRKVTVTGDEKKIDKIAKFYRGIEETTINERRGGMDVIRRIVKNHQYEGGVDVQTANMILKVYDGVDNKTKKFLDHATLKQIVNLILKARR